MKEDIETIIKMLERAQELMHRKDYSSANTLIYQAQQQAQFIKDTA